MLINRMQLNKILLKLMLEKFCKILDIGNSIVPATSQKIAAVRNK